MGNVYLDNNYDNVLDTGDSGIGGVTLTLTGMDANGNPVSRTTATAADGTYSFSNLTTGIYAVTEIPPAGYIPAGTTPGIPTDGNASANVIAQIVVSGGQQLVHYDFGQILPVSLNGADYLVSNTTTPGSLTTSTTGVPIPGTTVKLTGTDVLGNSVSQTTTTGPGGQYSFTGLLPSTSGYTVTETAAGQRQPPGPDLDHHRSRHQHPARHPLGRLDDRPGHNGASSTDNFFETVTASINGTDFLVAAGTTAGRPDDLDDRRADRRHHRHPHRHRRLRQPGQQDDHHQRQRASTASPGSTPATRSATRSPRRRRPRTATWARPRPPGAVDHAGRARRSSPRSS